MSNRKMNAAKVKAFQHPEPDGPRGLGLQLRKEIDRLALLLEQVRKQSERVQAAADAMGYNLVFDLESSINRSIGVDSKQWATGSRSRRAKVVPFAAGREQPNTQPF